MAKILNWGWKFPDPGGPGRGFYINPSRRGPVPGAGEKKGIPDPRPGGGSFLVSWGAPGGPEPGPRRRPPSLGAGPRREGLM